MYKKYPYNLRSILFFVKNVENKKYIKIKCWISKEIRKAIFTKYTSLKWYGEHMTQNDPAHADDSDAVQTVNTALACLHTEQFGYVTVDGKAQQESLPGTVACWDRMWESKNPTTIIALEYWMYNVMYM